MTITCPHCAPHLCEQCSAALQAVRGSPHDPSKFILVLREDVERMKRLTFTDQEIDHLLERYDQTEPTLQRKIVANFAARATLADDQLTKVLELMRDAIERVDDPNWQHEMKNKVAQAIGARP